MSASTCDGNGHFGQMDFYGIARNGNRWVQCQRCQKFIETDDYTHARITHDQAPAKSAFVTGDSDETKVAA